MSLKRFAGTGFGLGLVPFAPGTFGTLPGVALAYAASRLPATDLVLLGMAVAVTVLGVPLAAAAERAGKKDPRSFVVDEIAGYLVAVLGLPLQDRTALCLGLGFVLFRVFDIAKPWPIRAIERRPGAAAVMGDDLVAGLYANVALRLVLLVA